MVITEGDPICVYSETFDPPHKGHSEVVRWCLNNGIDRVVLVVKAHHSGHKLRSRRDDRIAMLACAMEPLQKEFPNRIVITQKRHDTELKSLKKEYFNRLIVRCERWGVLKSITDLDDYDQYWILRKDSREELPAFPSLGKHRVIAISSDEARSTSSRVIRELIQKKGVIPSTLSSIDRKVAEYIVEHQLYGAKGIEIPETPKENNTDPEQSPEIAHQEIVEEEFTRHVHFSQEVAQKEVFQHLEVEDYPGAIEAYSKMCLPPKEYKAGKHHFVDFSMTLLQGKKLLRFDLLCKELLRFSGDKAQVRLAFNVLCRTKNWEVALQAAEWLTRKKNDMSYLSILSHQAAISPERQTSYARLENLLPHVINTSGIEPTPRERFRAIIAKARKMTAHDLGKGFWSEQLFNALNLPDPESAREIADAWHEWKLRYRYENRRDFEEVLSFGLFFYESGEKEKGLGWIGKYAEFDHSDPFLLMLPLNDKWLKRGGRIQSKEEHSYEQRYAYCSEILNEAGDYAEKIIEKDAQSNSNEERKWMHQWLKGKKDIDSLINSLDWEFPLKPGMLSQREARAILLELRHFQHQLLQGHPIPLDLNFYLLGRKLVDQSFDDAIAILRNPLISEEEIRWIVDDQFYKGHFEMGMALLRELGLWDCPLEEKSMILIERILRDPKILHEMDPVKLARTYSFDKRVQPALVRVACFVGDFDFAYSFAESLALKENELELLLEISSYAKKDPNEWTNYLKLFKGVIALMEDPDHACRQFVRHCQDRNPFSDEEKCEILSLVSSEEKRDDMLNAMGLI